MSRDARRTAILALLLSALTAAPIRLAGELWNGVVAFDPGFRGLDRPAADAPSAARLSAGVTLVLVDGLRLDASREMPFLNALRACGASFDAIAGTPSFSRPGRATIATGAWPYLHGVTTNRQRRPLALDSLLRRAADAGLRCRVAGSPIWSGLFGAEISRCGVARDHRVKEGPGTFDRVAPEVRASQEAALAFLDEAGAELRILDVLSTDFAAHEFGGTSDRYRAEVARADEWIRRLASSMDLAKETIVVTSDHGHIQLDRHGGHGGDEAEVLAIPLVLAGAGVKPGARGRAEQVDVAPTVAALLGLAAPAPAVGRTLVEALSVVDGDAATRINESDRVRRRSISTLVSSVTESSPEADGRAASLEAIRAERRPLTGLAASAISALVVVTLLLVGGEDRARVLRGALLALVLAGGALLLVGEPVSLSTINYDEQVTAYFGRIAAIVASGALVATAASLVGARPASRARTALAIGVLTDLVLVFAYLLAWGREGLFAPRFLPEVAALTGAFVLLIACAAAGAAILSVASGAAAIGRLRGRGGGAPAGGVESELLASRRAQGREALRARHQ